MEVIVLCAVYKSQVVNSAGSRFQVHDHPNLLFPLKFRHSLVTLKTTSNYVAKEPRRGIFRCGCFNSRIFLRYLVDSLCIPFIFQLNY